MFPDGRPRDPEDDDATFAAAPRRLEWDESFVATGITIWEATAAGNVNPPEMYRIVQIEAGDQTRYVVSFDGKNPRVWAGTYDDFSDALAECEAHDRGR
jgi:hypothetical protein